MGKHARSRGRRAGCWTVLWAVVAGSLGACASAQGADGRPLVVTTVAPITSIVASVVGDQARVVGIVPEGINSHTFEPKPSVAKDLAQADIIFMNGLQLEEPTRKLAEANRKKRTELVQLGDRTITPEQYLFDFSFPKEEGKPNPHLWTNPLMAKRYAEIVAEAMSKIDPRSAAVYTSNLAAFSARIDRLDAAMRTAFATIPDGQRQLLTYHDAYGYFALEYGWTILGAIQMSDFEDPTPKDVVRLVQQLKASGVKAIFGSEVFPSPVLDPLSKEAGVAYVDDLRDDDLPGVPGGAEHSYLALMRFDFITMTEALGGDPLALQQVDVSPVVPDRAIYPQ